MNEAAKHLMAEMEENGVSFNGPRRQLYLDIMAKYLQSAFDSAKPVFLPQVGQFESTGDKDAIE